MYHRHQTAKRRVVLAAGAVYALSRAVAYLPGVRATPIQEPLLIAVGGQAWLLWTYLAAWAGAGLWCLWHLWSGRIVAPLSAVAGLMAAWGTAWLIGWLVEPGSTYWQTALTYWCPALMILTLMALTPRWVREG